MSGAEAMSATWKCDRCQRIIPNSHYHIETGPCRAHDGCPVLLCYGCGGTLVKVDEPTRNDASYICGLVSPGEPDDRPWSVCVLHRGHTGAEHFYRSIRDDPGFPQNIRYAPDGKIAFD